MANPLAYTQADFTTAPGGLPDLELLRMQLAEASLVVPFDRVESQRDGADIAVQVHFDSEPDAADVSAVGTLVADHDPAGAARAIAEGQIAAQVTADPLNGLEVTATASGLVITVDIETLVDGDETTITADGTDTKFAKACYVYDEDADSFSVIVYEKTTGLYADLNPPEYLIRDLAEFSVPASGTVLTKL